MMPQSVEFKCLVCGAQYVKLHFCPIGLCGGGYHFDFCRRCSKLVWKNITHQFGESPTTQPMRIGKIEDDDAA